MIPKGIELKWIQFWPKDKAYGQVALEEAIDIFNKTVEVRDQMGGALHYGMLND